MKILLRALYTLLSLLDLISRIKETLRHKFASAANNFERQLRNISSEISSMVGPLEVCLFTSFDHLRIADNYGHFQSQQDQIGQIQAHLAPLAGRLAQVAQIEEECRLANIEENDHTVFTHQDLEFELRLVQQTVVKKIKFIDNQVCCNPYRLRYAYDFSIA